MDGIEVDLGWLGMTVGTTLISLLQSDVMQYVRFWTNESRKSVLVFDQPGPVEHTEHQTQ